jgi:hypothetical protein
MSFNIFCCKTVASKYDKCVFHLDILDVSIVKIPICWTFLLSIVNKQHQKHTYELTHTHIFGALEQVETKFKLTDILSFYFVSYINMSFIYNFLWHG